MKRRRVFIGIDVPSDMRKRLNALTMQRFPDAPVAWSKTDNLHLTLHFIGYVDDDDASEICATVKALCETVESFDVQFRSCTLGPQNDKVRRDPHEAKMVWLSGPINDELVALQRRIVETLDQFPKDRKAFRPHITLGRIRARAWRTMNPVPFVQERAELVLPVSAVTVYESVTEGRRHRYIPLEVCPLNG